MLNTLALVNRLTLLYRGCCIYAVDGLFTA